MEKAQFTQLQNMMILMDIDALGIQTGPVTAHSTHFVLKIFHLFTSLLGSQFLLPQKDNNWKRNSPNSRIG